MIRSPIMAKELRPLLRSQRSFWLLLLALLAAGGTFGFYWMNSAGRISAFQASYYGRQMFLILSAVLLGALGLVSPILTATAIASERENNTLDLLTSTGLSRRQILLGKLGAALAYQFLFIACMLPILILPFQLGGIGVDEIFFAAVLIGVSVLTYGMLGLAVSCWLRKSVPALALTLALVLLPAMIVPGVAVLLANFRMFDSNEVTMTFPLSPIAVLMELGTKANSALLRSGVMIYGSSTILNRRISIGPAPTIPATSTIFQYFYDSLFVMHMVIQGCIFVSAWFVARWGLARRRMMHTATARQIIDDPAELERRKNRWPYYLVDPQRRAQSIGDRQNPLLVKEQRVGALSRPIVLIRLCYAGAFFSIFLGLIVMGYGRDSLPWLSLGLLAPLALMIVILSGTALTREREEQTMDLLRTSLLTPWQIVRAKFLVTMRFAFFLALSMLVTSGVLLVLNFLQQTKKKNLSWTELDPVITFAIMAKALCFALVFSAFYAALGLYFSARCRKSVNAVVSTFLFIVLLAAVPLIFSSIDQWLVGSLNGNFGNYHNEGYDPSRLIYSWLTSPPGKLVRYGYLHGGPLISPAYYLAQPERPYNNRRFSHASIQDDTWMQFMAHAALMLGLAWFILWRAGRRLGKEGRR